MKKWYMNRWTFKLAQDYCRWKNWDISRFPDEAHWNVMDKDCTLLGFILGSQKCPNCNNVDCLRSGHTYDAILVICDECKASYYQCAGFAQEPFNEHAAAVINIPDKDDSKK